MFARSYVIQTGRGRHDWKVASVGEVDPEFFPGPQTIGGYDPFYYTGDTYLLDVREAVRDPEREVTGENHWEFVASAHIAHNNGAGAQIWELDKDGWAKSQKVALFGGRLWPGARGRGRSAAVRVRPGDRRDDRLRSREPILATAAAAGPAGPAEQRRGPADRQGGDRRRLAGAGGRGKTRSSCSCSTPRTARSRPWSQPRCRATTIPPSRCWPTARSSSLGGNASDLANDPERTDAGVPNAQIYKPPYFFGGERPAIEKAPEKLEYGHVSWSRSRTRARRRSARSCSSASARSPTTGTGATAT